MWSRQLEGRRTGAEVRQQHAQGIYYKFVLRPAQEADDGQKEPSCELPAYCLKGGFMFPATHTNDHRVGHLALLMVEPDCKIGHGSKLIWTKSDSPGEASFIIYRKKNFHNKCF